MNVHNGGTRRVIPADVRNLNYGSLLPARRFDAPWKKEALSMLIESIFPGNQKKQAFMLMLIEWEDSFHYFLTLTSPELSGWQRSGQYILNAQRGEELLPKLLKKLNRTVLGRHGHNREDLFRIIAIPERGKNGLWHYHCALGVPQTYRLRFERLIDERDHLRATVKTIWRSLVMRGSAHAQLVWTSSDLWAIASYMLKDFVGTESTENYLVLGPTVDLISPLPWPGESYRRGLTFHDNPSKVTWN